MIGNEKQKLIKRVFFGKFIALKIIEKTKFSIVLEGRNIYDKSPVTIKIEKRKSSRNYLENEFNVLLSLKGNGISKIISYGKSGEYNIMIQELLGKSLLKLFCHNNCRLSLKEILCITGIQIIDRLEYVHSKDFINLNINPENLLLGSPDTSIIYLIDFALAKKYRASKGGSHIKFNKSEHYEFPFAFSSINSLKGIEQSRRDDLEYLGYSLIFLLTGSLSWKINAKKDLSYLYEIKKNITAESL